MPVLNALLKGFRITINGIDCSSAVNGELWLSLNRPKFSVDGLFPCTGTLNLLPVQGFSANFFNPRKNRAQWRRGIAVTAEVDLGNGLEHLFTGYILKRPATPATGTDGLAVSIGDELVYRDIEQPAEDRAGVRLGNARTRTEIIEAIASFSGWAGNWLGSIPEYPINYPIPKYQGSFVKQVGAIAASAGYGLYCDRFGNLQAAQFSLSPTPLIERSFADTQLEATDGSDEPAYEVQAVVSGRSVDPNALVSSEVIEDQGLIRYNSISGSTYKVETYITKRVTLTETWSPDYKTHILETKTEVPRIDELDQRRLILRGIERVISEYSRALDGKLSRQVREEYVGSQYLSAGDLAVAGDLNAQGLVTAREVETWTYSGEVPVRKEIARYGLLRTQFNGVTTQMEETLLGSTKTEWQQVNSDRWRQIETKYIPIEVNGVTEDQGISTVSTGPQYRPAEPRRHIPTDSSKDMSYKGSAYFGGVAEEDGEPAIYEFEYGVSDAQAEMLAELHGTVLIGRDGGFTCSMELGEEWLNWTPASAAQMVLPDGDVSLLLIDGSSINLSSGAGMVTFGLVDLGTVGYAPYTPLRGRIIGEAAPPTAPAPVYTPIVRPFQVMVSGRFGDRNGFEGAVALDSPQPEAASFGDNNGFEGFDPTGDSGRSFGDRNGFEADETPPPSVLPIKRGGTGATSAAAARANLGINAIAGGDLTGSYPNPQLAAVPDVAGTYETPTLTIDEKGRVISISEGVAASALTLANDDTVLSTSTARLNFTGAGVTVTADNAISDAFDIDIEGGGGGAGSSGLTLVGQEVLSAPAASISFDGVIDVAKHYKIVAEVRTATNSRITLSLYLSDDLIDSSYVNQTLFSSSTTVAGGRVSGPKILDSDNTATTPAIVEGDVFLYGGRFSYSVNTIRADTGGTVVFDSKVGQKRTAIASTVSGLTFKPSADFAAGTRISLYSYG